MGKCQNPVYAFFRIGNEDADLVKILRDRWDKAICQKLAEVGCPQLSGKGKWKDARKWLRDTKFPE